ncbi:MULTISPECIES: NADP-dependent oxidoreductase [unclassified Rathayibacter]|uniref:NADP-dependent oxidoreductase n=1 Tax=unclassified Rathayibacter TaxID=2609250 RepID=UPI00188AD8D8|nr:MULTISPECIES: NADP-dependent oxidoreductase [unclassified Rathayibacter]MBF4463198.1 NADP-dependent oxidoreductase [Rathayibacter sp. VKM Ac-2879]MBF4504565.1 NADP-dependent oxidoreductase [Rathayibacter sp. VKM Ac-2878]
MIAVQFDRPGPSSVLHLGERPMPTVSDGDILVQVRAAGVSPIDLSLRAGTSALTASLPVPHVTGIDAAGVVVERGRGVSGVELGDEVFGTVTLSRFGGAAAEFAVLAHWGQKPSAWSWEEACAAGSAVETATRALDLLDVFPGANVVVEGAAGGIGSIAAQLAVARGARVFGAAREESLHVVAALPGVTAVRSGEDWHGVLRRAGVDRVDAALDARGGGALPALIAAAGSADRVVTIADGDAAKYGVRFTRGALAGEPSGYHGLQILAELTRSAPITVPVRASYPFSQAAEAHDAAERRPRWGKVAMVNDQS